MFAVYASEGNIENPLASLVVGERPEPIVSEGWVRVKVSHASLNRHDIFTLMGVTGQAAPLVFPMILGNDGAGTLDDGTEVVIYPLMGAPDWRGDETLDPDWNIFSERVPGTFADYVVVPRRNAIPRPAGISALDASVMGTAWLTAYRMLFTKSGLKPGQTMLVQGGSGGVATALIQLGRAAGIEVWATSRTREGRELAERLGAHRTFASGEKLPRRVEAVMDSVGKATWPHTLESVGRGGTVVTMGMTTGNDPSANLMRLFVEQITVAGTIMGTREDMNNLVQFVISAGIKPAIGQVLPMEEAKEGFRGMVEVELMGKRFLLDRANSNNHPMAGALRTPHRRKKRPSFPKAALLLREFNLRMRRRGRRGWVGVARSGVHNARRAICVHQCSSVVKTLYASASLR